MTIPARTLAGAILAAVPTSLERLDRAFADAEAASGANFFRRLRDYQRLVDTDDTICAAVEQMRGEVEEAGERLEAEDEGVIRDLIRCREVLAERAPEVDDSGLPRRQGTRLDPETRASLESWQWTLANFDAIAVDGEDKLVQRRNLDGTDARMLGEILFAKLHNLLYPTARVTSRRPDLDDLYREVNEVRGRHTTAQTHLEEVTQDSGYLPLRRVALVSSFLRPREASEARTEDEEREFAEAVLMEVSGDFHHLREAVRPDEARGPLDRDAQRAVERAEPDSEKDLADLHRMLALRVEDIERAAAPSGWRALDASQKIQVAGIVTGAIVGIAAIVVTVALTA